MITLMSFCRETWDGTLQQLQSEVNQLQSQIVTLEGSPSPADSSTVIWPVDWSQSWLAKC